MRIDLFEFVDGLIRGVIFFLYNFIETTAAILRHPIRAPMRLTRRHDDPAVRQMGGSTYLFLIVLPVQKLSIDAGAGRDGDASFAEFLTNISMQAPDFQSDALWPDIVAALIATVIVDGALRLALRWRLPNRRRFRHALLSATEFAMAWPILVLLTYSVLAVLVDMEDPLIGLAGGLALTIAVPASLYPAAVILTGARPRRGAGARRGKRALAVIGLTILFMAALASGSGFASEIQERRQMRAYFAKQLKLQPLRCTLLPDGRLGATVLLQQWTGDAEAVEADDLRLLPVNRRTGETDWDSLPRSDRHGWAIQWRDGRPDRVLIVESGRAQVAEVVTTRPIGLIGSEACDLYIRVFGPKWTRDRAAEDGQRAAPPIRPWRPASVP